MRTNYKFTVFKKVPIVVYELYSKDKYLLNSVLNTTQIHFVFLMRLQSVPSTII